MLNKKMAKLIFITFLSFMLAGCGGGGSSEGGGNNQSPNNSQPSQKITLMVYFAADNNLGPYAKQDIEELRLAATNSNIKVIFQTEYPESSHTMRGVIENNKINYIDTGSNLNMADKKTLQEFIAWGKTNYKADKYIVSLWSHGLGWRFNGVSGDLHTKLAAGSVVSEEVTNIDAPFHVKFNENKFITSSDNTTAIKGAIADDTSNSFMSIADIGEALKSAGGADILVFDACLMQMAEVAYSIKDAAKVMIASEDNVPATGFQYTNLINSIANSADLTNQKIGEKIAQTYIESYQNSKTAVQVSVLDLTKLTDLRNSVANFSASLYPIVDSEKGNISQAKQQSSDFYNQGHMDLAGFMQNYKNITSNTGIKLKIDDVLSKASSVVLYNNIYIPANTTSYNQGAKGIGLYLPSSAQINQDASLLAQYQNLDFNKNITSGRAWSDIVQSYSNATAIPKVVGKFDYIARWSDPNIDIDLLIQDPSNSILTAFNSSSSIAGNGIFTQDSILSNQPTESYFANEMITSGPYGVYLFYTGCSNGNNPSTDVNVYYKDRTQSPAAEILVGSYNLNCSNRVAASMSLNNRAELKTVGNGYYTNFRFVQEINR